MANKENKELRDLTYRLVKALSLLMKTPNAGTINQLALLTEKDFDTLWVTSTADKV